MNHLRWLMKPSGDKVLQELITNTIAHGPIWRDVPCIDERNPKEFWIKYPTTDSPKDALLAYETEVEPARRDGFVFIKVRELGGRLK